MLGVLKRRWKPKRASNGDINSIDNNDKPRLAPSTRQVHPVAEEKAQLLAYEKHSSVVEARPKRPSIDLNASPPPYQKRASVESNPSPTSYPLAPNIIVEGGRIEFAKPTIDGAVDGGVQTPPSTPRLSSRITVTRGQQTNEDGMEKYDDAKEKLELRVSELEAALEAAQKTELKDKQAVAKLQRQLSRREAAQRDADRERRMRADSEARAKQALQEAARCRSRLKLLTSEFSRMEDSVRSMLVYKKQAEQLRQEKMALTNAFENRCQQYQNTISRLNQEILSLRNQLEQVNNSSQEGLLQAHTAALHRHAEESRKQYERCLDDVANQVVKALLAQKGLREEVGNLNHKIQELETQNRALTSMLVHQLRGDNPFSGSDQNIFSRLALEDSQSHQEEQSEDNNTSADASPTNLMRTSLNFKHCNSFNSEILEHQSPCQSTNSPCENVVSRIEKRLSADSEVLDTRFSLEDKKRHQVLTKLWTEIKGTEVTPKKLIEALSAVDSALWVPPQRPVSLNLQLPILQAAKYRRSRPILAQSASKSEEETTGNESPESGNRDEGYSTMSSDVQAEVTRGSGDVGVQTRGLEDLKEATDETDIAETRLLITDNTEPDILYIPFNLLNLKPRNSFPPGKDVIPFQHIVRSFSDSHLCIKITTAPGPYYTFTSPISSSPSILFVDITEKTINPLRRTKATASHANIDHDDTASPHSWSSIAEERLECSSWDAEYIQHWLRLDETRSTLQQHRDLFELEYDRTELEDWSLSLSADDIRENWKKHDATTPGQISLATLPSIQENNALELEEDSNECLWNNPSYLMDKEGHEIVTLLMDNGNSEKQWPYALNGSLNLHNSPDNSWSSGGSDCCHSHEPETYSKRSSAALSGCSDDTGELPVIGTDFTRDFYRLVKFESTKSLASTSSRSLGGALSEIGDRDAALQNVLTFIAEQQKYVHCRDASSRPCSVNEITKEFNIEAPPQELGEIKICDCSSDMYLSNKSNSPEFKISENENYVTLRQLCTEFTLNEQNTVKTQECKKIESFRDEVLQNVAYADEICLVTPIDVESENCSNISEHPVDICSSVSVEITNIDYQTSLDENVEVSDMSTSTNDLIKSSDTISDSPVNMSESLTSSNSTPDTVVSKIPRRKYLPSKIPISPAKTSQTGDSKLPKSRIPSKNISRPKTGAQKQKIVSVAGSQPQHLITSEKLPQPSSGVISNIIDGPPHRAVSFHERATSKDVIDELNRMIKNGDETTQCSSENIAVRLDEACRSTGWVHVEQNIDLNDPKARATLLDVMMTSVSSDSSPTSSCGGSITSESTEDPPDYGQLHRIHKFHRQKKANAARPELAVVRASLPAVRPSIIGRPDFFIRYGDKEKEAVASFDFLDTLSTTSSSSLSSSEEALPPDDDSNVQNAVIL